MRVSVAEPGASDPGPCARCGGRAVVRLRSRTRAVHVACLDCGLEGPPVKLFGREWQEVVDRAIRKWRS